MAEIGQAAALRSLFKRIYAATAPRHVLVLGCTTGKDLALIDPEVTTRAVGVDVNAEYLVAARGALEPLGRNVELVHGDVLDVDLPLSAFDLIHAALLVEYVSPAALFRRIRDWLAPAGVCSIVSQDPTEGVPAVSKTAYESLHNLGGRMALIGPDQLNSLADEAGLERTSLWDVRLPGGKSFSTSLFQKPKAPSNRSLQTDDHLGRSAPSVARR